MVIKLIKRELKDSVKFYGPMQIMIIGLFIGFGIFINSIQKSYMAMLDITSGLSLLAIVVILLALAIIALLANIYILYTSIYGDRGYDLFTMPVTSTQIILSKILTIFTWSIASIVTSAIGAFILLVITGSLSSFLSGIVILFENLQFILGSIDYSNIALLAFQSLTNLVFASMLILFCGAIGNSSKVQKNRVLMTVLIYFGLNMIVNVIEAFITGPTIFSGIAMTNQIMITVIILRIALIGLMTLGTIWIWENKLEIL